MGTEPRSTEDSKSRNIFILLWLAGGIFFFAVGLFTGVVATEKLLTKAHQKEIALIARQNGGLDMRQFWYVKNKIDREYIDPSKLDPNKMAYGAISGLVQSVGDKYTYFYPPEISKQASDERDGNYVGVELTIEKKDEMIMVTTVFQNGPARESGILEGDIILKVNGRDVTGLETEEVVALIRGVENTPVTLTLGRLGKKKTFELTVRRKKVKREVFHWKLLNNKIAYIKLSSFDSEMLTEFKRIAREIKKSGADKIILDIRYNPGGRLKEAVEFMGWFLENESPVVILQKRDGRYPPYTCKSLNPSFKNFPVVVLINQFSASASEIVAGALRADRKIPLVGLKTFGKGVAQTLISLPDGSLLVMTDAYWFTPDGISISEKGIEPDKTVSIKIEDIESGKVHIGEAGKDPQLDAAIDILQEKIK